MYGEDAIAVQLMFYSTFEMLDLRSLALFRSDGNSSHCEVVLAYFNVHPLCQPRLNCAQAGASALDALVSPRKLYASNPALFP